MENSVTLLLMGGLISLVSTLAGIALQHWFDLQTQERETRRYPTQVLYGKQTEFYDKSAQILPKVNGYITTVNVRLEGRSLDAKRKAKESADKTEPVWKFHELMESYYMYLPKDVLRAGNQLLTECMFLPNDLTVERTEICMDLLLAFQNTIRQCVGVDQITKDLLIAFGAQEQEKTDKTETE